MTLGATSGDVYRELVADDEGQKVWRYWIEQSQAGSKLHSAEERDLFWSAVLPHSMTGNFKLCSGDGTGGSRETALHNWRVNGIGFDFDIFKIGTRYGKRSKAKVGGLVNARTQAIIPEQYRGSYDFADSMFAGFDEHERLDMEPDDEYKTRYINERRWTPIGERRFMDFNFD